MGLDHWEKLFDHKYLRWFDLEGKEVAVEIEAVQREELTMRGGIKKTAPVITLKGKKKQFVLNKTNARTIAGLHGWKPQEDWIGKKITLFQDETQFYDSELKKMTTVPCIRVKPA